LINHVKALFDLNYVKDHVKALFDLNYVKDHVKALFDLNYVRAPFWCAGPTSGARGDAAQGAIGGGVLRALPAVSRRGKCLYVLAFVFVWVAIRLLVCVCVSLFCVCE
jgi:hypothetical protein